MRELQRERKFRKKFFSKPVLALLLAAAVFVLSWALRMSYRAWVAASGREESERALLTLEAEKKELEARISRLSNPIGIEKEAKERFNVKSPGEEVLVIIDPKLSSGTTTPGTGGEKLWQFLKDLFK